MRRAVRPLVIAVGAVALACWLKGSTDSPRPPPAPNTPEDRISKLKRKIAEQEEESAQAVAKYIPTRKARIDDLDSPIADLLRQLPGVVLVEVGVTSKKPTSRIVHLRYWHFVPKDLYALDMKDTLGPD